MKGNSVPSGGGMRASASGPLTGTVTAPGDKSISHRALILGALATGETQISGLLESDDVLRTAAAMRSFGAEIDRDHGTDGVIWRVCGRPWEAPDHTVYLGNSGTGARLIFGAAVGAGVNARFDGDASLRSRPMGRVMEPLRTMGLEANAHDGRLPMEIEQSRPLSAVNIRLVTPSAQVKSAILLAALGAEGRTTVHEPILCRDHTERMLGAFGAKLETETDGEQGRFIHLNGPQTLSACNVAVPGDPSSAAFIAAAAAVVPGSDVTIKNVLVNPTRFGFFETLSEMGADMSFINERMMSGERVCDIRVRHSVLRGVSVPEAHAASMIDEYPILSIVAAFAEGETLMTGIEELRVKESDRISSVEAGLMACGIDVKSGDDWLRVSGNRSGSLPRGGGSIKTVHDHRIAMSFLVLGLASKKPVKVDDTSMIATSFPVFSSLINDLGGRLESHR